MALARDNVRMPLEQRCLILASTTELEALQERILHEFSDMCGAQSGALWVSSERTGLRLRAFRGLVDRRALPETVDPALVQYLPWRAGNSLLVPIVSGAEVLGLVQLAHPLSEEFGEDLMHPAQVLAGFTAAALRAANRITSLQRQGLRDRETGAYTLSYFTDYSTKEIYKARRYGRSFSLLTFSLDNLPQIRGRLGPQQARAAQRVTLKVISAIIRDSDVVARATDTEFHVLLPETDYFGGLMFLRRAMTSVRAEAEAKAIEAKVPFGLTGGAATFPHDGDDFDELLAKCRQRMDERRKSLQVALQLDGLPFWDEVDLLLGNSRSPHLPAAPGEPSRRGKVADVLFDELQTEIARELLREKGTRGLLYVGSPEVRSDLPIILHLEGTPDLAAQIYVLGRHADVQSHSVITPVFLEGDDRLNRHEFLLWLGDGWSYALLQRRGRGLTWGFHTSDPTLVEGLVSQLQHQYDLQPW
ncbi:MAG: diguanylate cyclase [Myxococcaceae bacterium]